MANINYTYLTSDSIIFNSVIDTISGWNSINNYYTVSVAGYYSIQSFVTIDSSSQTACVLNVAINSNYYFILRLENNYGSYSSSGLYITYCNIGDIIKIINVYNNCILYNDNNSSNYYGGLKIHLL